MPLRPYVRSALVCCAIFTPTTICLAAENIVQSSEVVQATDGKLVAVLMVGTRSLVIDTALGNKQALVGAEVRKLLKSAGIQVFPIGIRREDKDPAEIVKQAVAKNNPSHVMTITVPSGEIYVERLTGEPTGGAKKYVVKSEIVDAKTNLVVWKYTAEVTATFGATNAEVAEALVSKLRSDKLL